MNSNAGEKRKLADKIQKKKLKKIFLFCSCTDFCSVVEQIREQYSTNNFETKKTKLEKLAQRGMAFFLSLWALLVKNVHIKRRHWLATIMEVVLPIIFFSAFTFIKSSEATKKKCQRNFHKHER